MKAQLFGAPWCANCNTIKQILDTQGVTVVEMTGADQQSDDVLYINVDQFAEVAQQHTIRSLPTLITESGDRYVGLLKIKEYVDSQSN